MECYRAYSGGAFPGQAATEAGLKSDLEPYLRAFPTNPVRGSAVVAVQDRVPINGRIGCRYDATTGQLVANSNGTGSDGLRYYEW